MKEKIFQTIAAAAGAVASFFCGLPPILWVLLAVMSLDYITGLICGAVGKSPKGNPAQRKNSKKVRKEV